MPASCPVCSNQFPDGTEACPEDGASLTASADWQEKTHARFQSGRTDAMPEPAMPAEPTVHVEDDFRTLTGRTLGDYVVGEKLGTGGMGEVYLADHKVIGKKVAIKFLKREYAADPDCVNRMLTEARAVSTIRHQGIIDIYNFGTLPDGRPYLVMEYLVGEPLDVVILRGALPQREAVEFLEEICTTLAAAHAAGVIHRDLKPANIFILTDPTTGEKRLKLLDFGLAKAQRLAASGPATRVGLAMGTPDYMSPEQARGVTVSAQTDLYAVGVMAFELLTGKVPFVAPSVMELMILHLRAPVPRVSSLLSNVSADLDELVAHLMAKAPEERPASADAVRRELKRIGASLREQRTQIVAAPLDRPERVDLGLAPTVPLAAPLAPRRDSGAAVPKAAARERRVSSPAMATPARVSAPPQSSFDQNEVTAAALSATAGSRKVVLGLVAVVVMLAVALGAMLWKERSALPVEPEPVAVAEAPPEPTKVVPPEVKPEPPPQVKPAPPPEVKPEPPPEVKPAPPPAVKPEPRPEPVRPLVVAKKAPTAVELKKALDRALAQPRATRMSERLITEKARLLRRDIEAEQTPVQRSASLAQIREFERQLTGVR